jgi:hypothetical protein
LVSNPNVTGFGVKTSTSNKPLSSKILRKVPEQEGFHFYLGIGEPTGKTAVSLVGFVEKLETVNVRSVNFHYPRRDFEKWVLEVLGDTELASRLNMISSIHVGMKGEALRNHIIRVVKVRLSELKPQPPATSKPPAFSSTLGTGKPIS